MASYESQGESQNQSHNTHELLAYDDRELAQIVVDQHLATARAQYTMANERRREAFFTGTAIEYDTARDETWAASDSCFMWERVKSQIGSSDEQDFSNRYLIYAIAQLTREQIQAQPNSPELQTQDDQPNN